MVKAQQVIILIPLFDIEIPANALTIYGVLMQIAAFEMIPTDTIYENMISQLEKEEVKFDETL